MWFLNHVGNPVVRLLLRSPLSGPLSRSFLLLTYEGCRSGREVTLPVQYRVEHATYVVTVGAPEAKQWWRNFVAPREAVLLVRRAPVACKGEVEEDAGTVRVRFTPN